MPKISVIDLFKQAIFLLLKITGGLILLFLIIFSIRIFTHQLGYKPPEGSIQQVSQQNHTQSPGILLTQPTNPENSVQVNFDGLLMHIPETADVLARIKSEKTPQPVAVDGIARDFMFPEMRQTTCAFNPYLPRTKEHFPVCVTSSFRNTDPAHALDRSTPTPGRNAANFQRTILLPAIPVSKSHSDLITWFPNMVLQKFDATYSPETDSREYSAKDDAPYEASVSCKGDCTGDVYIKELAIQYHFSIPLVAEEKLEDVIQAINALYANWAQMKLSKHVAPIKYVDLIPGLSTSSEAVSLIEPTPQYTLQFTTQGDMNPNGVKLIVPSSKEKIKQYSTFGPAPYTCCVYPLVFWYPQMVLSDEDTQGLHRDKSLTHPYHFKVLINFLYGYTPLNDGKFHPHLENPAERMPFLFGSGAGSPNLRETRFSNLWRWYSDREYQEKRKGIWEAKDQYFVSKETAPYEAYVYCSPESGQYCMGEVYIKDMRIQYHFLMQSEGRESLGNVIEATNAMIRGWAHS